MMIYLLKVNLAIALFYAFYRLFFYRDTFFGWRRAVLLSCMGISVLIPLLNFQSWKSFLTPVATTADKYFSVWMSDVTVAPQSGSFWTEEMWLQSLKIVYLSVVAVLLVRLLWQLWQLVRLAFRCPTREVDGIKVRMLDSVGSPFSFFHWIFVNPKMLNDEQLNEILVHELTHAGQYHSMDVLFSEVFCAFNWFNPFAWLLKREVKINLEYLADDRVLSSGSDSKAYQYHLLGLTYQRSVATISNKFNVLPLKKRIRMMNCKRSNNAHRAKYVLIVPLAALLLLVSNIETVAHSLSAMAHESRPTELPGVMADTLKNGVNQVVDEMPEFPGGMSALMSFIAENIRYPKEAVEKKIEGRCIVRCVIDENGRVTEPAMLRKVHPLLDAEALRVVGLMPQWKPGKQNGKAVKVAFSFPVMFSLSKDGKGSVPVAGSSRKEVNTDNNVYEVVEQMPEFPGGTQALMAYISQNIQYPKEAVTQKIEGRCIVKCVVAEDGQVTQVSILRGVNPLLDDEAVRVIKSMPKWKPGMKKGKPVNVQYTIPVVFKLK